MGITTKAEYPRARRHFLKTPKTEIFSHRGLAWLGFRNDANYLNARQDLEMAASATVSPRKENYSRLYNGDMKRNTPKRTDDKNNNVKSSPLTPSKHKQKLGESFSEQDMLNCDEETKKLVKDFIAHKALDEGGPPPDKYAQTLRRIGDRADENHSIAFKGIIDKLKFDPEKDGYTGYKACLDSMLDEGIINWGRIVIIFVFSARLAKYMKECDLIEHVESVEEFTIKYIKTCLSKWILQNGGWEGMYKYFDNRGLGENIMEGVKAAVPVLAALAAFRYWSTTT